MNIAVIGGGPAGMMSAITASQNGATVTLYEKNEKLGKKIYITGKGRCNLTNECTNTEFLDNVVTNQKFMMSAINKWSSRDTMEFFLSRGLMLKTERGGRVFPNSDKASDVTKILTNELNRLGVNICLNCPINNLQIDKNGVLLTTITDIVHYDKVIIACGGVSYSKTGSTGDGYTFAKNLGHNIIIPKPALTEILIKQDISMLEGLSLKNVNLTAIVDNKVVSTQFGEMLFTHNGISGPIALTVSSYINRYLVENKQVKLSLDLKPALHLDGRTPDLDQRIIRDFQQFSNKEFANSLQLLFPDRLSQYIVQRSNIPFDKRVNKITAQERKSFGVLIKNLTFDVTKLADIERAIITSGGVDVKQIQPSTMQSKLCPNIYFAGETIDVDALTGGYNMQIAFSTGYLAGLSASKIADK